MTEKEKLLDALRERVALDLETLVRGQRDSQRGATHEESRAEHAKDTRATEQSYLARGLAERVAGLQRVADQLAHLELRAFGPDDAIAATALVTLRDLEEHSNRTWWLVPGAGGIDLPSDGGAIRTVTPAAPLGRALLDRFRGDELELTTPRGARALEVIDVR